jgi:ribosomal subunit interface protein
VDITISCRHTELPPAVEAAAHDKVARLGRFLSGDGRAEVHFDEEHNPRISDKERCEVRLESGSRRLTAKAAAPDAMAALERATQKLEHQLRKQKTKAVERPHVAGRREAQSRRDLASERLDEERSA